MRSAGIMRGISATVLVLGFSSFLTDVSSEMIFAVLPFFYLSIGAAPGAVGLIEGIAEGTTSLLKVYSGWYSDRVGRRKVFITGGYGLSAISKIFFAVAASWWHVLIVRAVDRAGKGLRTPSRDALIADATEPKFYGKSFGFHKAMDTAGAVTGVAIAFVLVSYFTYRQIFLVAVAPAILSVFLIIFFIKEARKKSSSTSFKLTFMAMDRNFKVFLLIATVFALANFSYVFLMWKATAVVPSDKSVILLYLLFNVFYAVSAMPAGMLSDRISKRHVIAFGYSLFGLTCVGFLLANTAIYLAFLFALYGIYYAFMEGVQKAYVAELVSSEARGTAFGIFNTVIGLAAIPASFIAGVLWQYVSSAATFIYGFGMSSLAVLLFLILMREK